jgi:hypothetical protein
VKSGKKFIAQTFVSWKNNTVFNRKQSLQQVRFYFITIIFDTEDYLSVFNTRIFELWVTDSFVIML